VWSTDIVPQLKGLARPMFSAARLVGERDGVLTFAVPNEPTRAKTQQHAADVEAVAARVVGAPVKVVIVVDGTSASDDDSGDASNVVQLRTAPPPPDEEVDLSDLIDVPPDAVQTPEDRLLDAFPGSRLIEE
jgi:DNA polymerase-3 subunit gamma/tau